MFILRKYSESLAEDDIDISGYSIIGKILISWAPSVLSLKADFVA